MKESMQLRINYNSTVFRREVKQIIKKAFSYQLSAVSFINHNNYLFYSSKSIAIAPI